jgi:hypothetical protein
VIPLLSENSINTLHIMETIKEILSSKRKPKEKVIDSAEMILKDHSLFMELIKIMETGTDVERGNCADIMKHVTAENPEIAEPYIDDLVKYINFKTPRVKWGVPESIGNIAKRHPEKVEKAIPFLFKNTIESKDNSTVIRWCSTYALSEIAKASKKLELIYQIDEAAKKETNNGVRNVYLKAIKEVKKDKL